MGKVKCCSIALTDPWQVYRPGDSVSGTTSLEIEGQIKIRKIRVVCKGQALTKWDRFMKRGFESDYESTEMYCNTYIDVYTANPPNLMAAGIYKYDFSFKLPREGLPSSFEGSLGAVRYWITVEVDKPFLSINDRFYKSFTVLANIDLNEAVYRRSARVSAEKPLSKALGIGHAGTLTASLSLDRSGYCPGEQICINLEAKNDSTKDIGLVKVSLVQLVHYKAAESTDSTTRTIRTIQSDKLGKGQSVKWFDQLMSVDLVPPSSKHLTCHIIRVAYLVRMEVEVPLGLDLEIRIPITICTVPLGMSLPGNAAQLKYALCTAGYQIFCKTTSGFPNLSYIPRTVIVKVTKQQPLATSKNSGAVAMCPARNVESVLTAVPTSMPQATESAYSKATEAAQPVSHVVLDSTDVSSLPTYEEACANLNTHDPVPQYTPVAPDSGCIIILLFPCMDKSLMCAAFKRSTSSLLLQSGRVLASVSQVQLLPSEQTAAVLIRFDSQSFGLRWLKTMTDSNTELSSRWHVLIGVNKRPNKYLEDTTNYKFMSMKLFQHRTDFKHSRDYWGEYNLLLNQALVPVKEKHKVRTLVSGKVIFAHGDWSSFSCQASELTMVVAVYPDRESYEAFLRESDNNPEIARFRELFTMYCDCLFKAEIETGDTTTFQDV